MLANICICHFALPDLLNLKSLRSNVIDQSPLAKFISMKFQSVYNNLSQSYILLSTRDIRLTLMFYTHLFTWIGNDQQLKALFDKILDISCMGKLAF